MIFMYYRKSLSGQGENDRKNCDLRSFGLDSESRSGKIGRDLDLQHVGKIATHNRQSDLDLQQCWCIIPGIYIESFNTSYQKPPFASGDYPDDLHWTRQVRRYRPSWKNPCTQRTSSTMSILFCDLPHVGFETCHETGELPDPRPTKPKRTRFKVAFGQLFPSQQIIFGRLRMVLYRKQTTKNLTQPNSPQTP